MDGNQITVKPPQRPARSLAILAIAGACCISAHGVAEAPPLFEVEDVSIQPIEALPAASSPVNRAPSLLRPRPRVLAAQRPPMVAVLADASQPAGSDSQPLPPRLMVVEQPNSRTGSVSSDPMLTIEQALDRRGSVTFRKTPLSEVVFMLSELWKINIVAGADVTGEVSGAFHDAPLREVLAASLAAAGYSYRQTGSSLIVLPLDQVGSDDASFVSMTLQLPRSLADDAGMLEAAQLLLSDRGQLRKIGADAVLVVDSEARIARVRKLLDDLSRSEVPPPPAAPDVPQMNSTPTVMQSGIAYFTPQYTEAEEMAQPLQDALGETVVVAVYAQENRIMVKGEPDQLRLAAEAIQQLDIPRPQVRISAMIYDVSLRELERLGVDWNVTPHSSAIQALSPSDDTLVFRNAFNASTNLITDPTVKGATNLAIRTLNSNIDAAALLHALDSMAEAKLLADPSVTVGDRRQASIKIVQRIPIIAADPIADAGGVVFSSVQFEDAGVILNVTPRISRDGTIEMQVHPEFSVVTDFILNNPVIDSRTADTTVRVADGQMFVLGGLRQKTIIETIRGVPFLKDVRYVGKFFRNHDSEIRESELIVFVKPELSTPYYGGTLREQRAGCVGNQQLDAIAHGDVAPQTPYCQDCNCPNHVPRPRINGGSRSLEMIEGFEIEGFEIEGETIPHDAVLREAEEVIISDEAVEQVLPPAVEEVNDAFPPVHVHRGLPR